MKKPKSRQSRVKRPWPGAAGAVRARAATVICMNNESYPASLEKWKIYRVLRDATAEKHGLIRVFDESGEDYLYPKMLFRSIVLPRDVKKAVLAAA